MKQFVVQFHKSRSPHYDFRLELDGVFKSWVVPKGLPEVVGIRRLALTTPDHELSFGEFEGEIPGDEPGAVTITIWDQGFYKLLYRDDGHLEFILLGKRLSGRYHMIRFQRGGERAWLIFRSDELIEQTCLG